MGLFRLRLGVSLLSWLAAVVAADLAAVRRTPGRGECESDSRIGSSRYDTVTFLTAFALRMDRQMADEKITVRVTSSDQRLDVVVLDKRLDRIQIVLGEGVHNVRCDLLPTRNGAAYVGNAMGRELVYERSREEVKADLARAAGFRDFKR